MSALDSQQLATLAAVVQGSTARSSSLEAEELDPLAASSPITW